MMKLFEFIGLKTDVKYTYILIICGDKKLTNALTETPVWMGFREHDVLLLSGRYRSLARRRKSPRERAFCMCV